MRDAAEVVRDAIEVTVQHAVVHVLDHRGEGLILSDEELAFDDNKPLRDYFSEQVEKALNDAQMGAARFSTDGEQGAIQECYRILTDGNHLVASSKALAVLLFDAMGKNVRILPGSLAVCLYTAANYPGKNFLALIKLDPMTAFVQKIERRQGKKFVSYEKRGNVMPTKGEKLHKAAIIPPAGTSKNFDLLLLDRQVAKVAAHFFAFTFLNAISVLDPTQATEKLFYATQGAYNRLTLLPRADPAHLEPEDGYALQQHVQAALQTPIVNLRRWLAALPLNEEAKAVVAQEIGKKLPGEGRVLVNQQHARDVLLKKKRFRGELGVVFEVNSDSYDDVVKEVQQKTRPDGKVVTTMTIEVPDLQWVRK